MNWFWLWSMWLIFIAVTFALGEGYAIYSGGITLSRYIWTLSKDWPPTPYVVGLFVGFLAAHFFWPDQGLDH